MRALLAGLAFAAPLALIAVPAHAQQSDRVASAAIERGDYAMAERVLTQELRIHPNRPELLLNLAAVYSRTGRQAEARGLYRQVLTQDDVLMDLSPERTAGSHSIATVALRQLDGVQVASAK